MRVQRNIELSRGAVGRGLDLLVEMNLGLMVRGNKEARSCFDF